MAVGRVVLDTDVAIDFLRGHGSGVATARTLLGEGAAILTAITAYELRQGARSAADVDAVTLLCASRTLALSVGAALRAGQVGAALRAAGAPIGAADTLIAGICLHHGLALATSNHRHFARVEGLTLHPAD